MFETIHTVEAYRKIVEESTALLVYFSSESCNVCKVLKPKAKDLLDEKFPLMIPVYVDIEKSPLISGQNRIFTIPTILLYFEGKESLRVSRNISIAELENSIGRIYHMLYPR